VRNVLCPCPLTNVRKDFSGFFGSLFALLPANSAGARWGHLPTSPQAQQPQEAFTMNGVLAA